MRFSFTIFLCHVFLSLLHHIYSLIRCSSFLYSSFLRHLPHVLQLSDLVFFSFLINFHPSSCSPPLRSSFHSFSCSIFPFVFLTIFFNRLSLYFFRDFFDPFPQHVLEILPPPLSLSKNSSSFLHRPSSLLFPVALFRPLSVSVVLLSSSLWFSASTYNVHVYELPTAISHGATQVNTAAAGRDEWRLSHGATTTKSSGADDFEWSLSPPVDTTKSSAVVTIQDISWDFSHVAEERQCLSST